jgi:cytochrome bd ubiquinol oxidase subunit II
VLTLIGVPVTALVRPRTLNNFTEHPWLYVIPMGVALSPVSIWLFEPQGKEMAAFLASCGYLALMLAGAAAALYPALLPSSGDPSRDITIYNAATGQYALRVGLIWWGFGMCLAVACFGVVYRTLRGKVQSESARSAEPSIT